ncbi:MAG: ATP-binding region ATPase domain protein [Gemmatimonadetes bacterium]|jgi:signal transduction histidine kinase|nr:ATP-binding region ATPase domain protein [Gemmatimonadota bacterium]
MRRGAPLLFVGLLLAILLASYVVYTRRVVQDLRRESLRSSRMYARVFRAQSDTSEGAGTQALFDLSKSIVEQGVPLIVTDTAGRPTAHANLPPEIAASDSAVRAYVRHLDGQNAPVVDSIAGRIHYGNTPLVRWLRIIPALQAATACVLLLLAVYIVRTRGNAERERVWAGMARESAHQLGTPLSSLAGWIELLEDQPPTRASLRTAVLNMRADLERLDRVAHRFERIGRDRRHDAVDLSALVQRVTTYFRARVPTLAHAVHIDVVAAPGPLTVQGDAVLLEWALEVLVKNAVDALAGRGGRILVTAAPAAQGGGAHVTVADDGPGIPRELRRRVFEPGFSTKQRGWGIGLSLARRIVEENHGGSLRLAASDRGATFEIILS